jgi:hypothetical protein
LQDLLELLPFGLQRGVLALLRLQFGLLRLQSHLSLVQRTLQGQGVAFQSAHARLGRLRTRFGLLCPLLGFLAHRALLLLCRRRLFRRMPEVRLCLPLLRCHHCFHRCGDGALLVLEVFVVQILQLRIQLTQQQRHGRGGRSCSSGSGGRTDSSGNSRRG